MLIDRHLMEMGREPMNVTVCFLSGDSLPDLHMQPPSIAACFWVFLTSVLSSGTERLPHWGSDQATDLNIEEYPISLTSDVLESSSICTLMFSSIGFAALCWMCIDLYAPDFILLCLSVVTSSINSEPVAMTIKYAHAVTLPPPCLSHGSWAASFSTDLYQHDKLVNHGLICPNHLFSVEVLSVLPVLERYQWFAPCCISSHKDVV